MCVYVRACVCVCVCPSHILSFQTGSGLKLTGGLPYSMSVTLIAKVTVQLVSGYYNPFCVWEVCFSFLPLNIFCAVFFLIQGFFSIPIVSVIAKTNNKSDP